MMQVALYIENEQVGTEKQLLSSQVGRAGVWANIY
jgi:hypothetical protein